MPWASGRLEVCRIEIAVLVLWLDGSLQDEKGLSCGLAQRRRCPPRRGGGHAARFYDAPSTKGTECACGWLGGKVKRVAIYAVTQQGPSNVHVRGVRPLWLTNNRQDNALFLCHTHNTHTLPPLPWLPPGWVFQCWVLTMSKTLKEARPAGMGPEGGDFSDTPPCWGWGHVLYETRSCLKSSIKCKSLIYRRGI